MNARYFLLLACLCALSSPIGLDAKTKHKKKSHKKEKGHKKHTHNDLEEQRDELEAAVGREWFTDVTSQEYESLKRTQSAEDQIAWLEQQQQELAAAKAERDRIYNAYESMMPDYEHQSYQQQPSIHEQLEWLRDYEKKLNGPTEENVA